MGFKVRVGFFIFIFGGVLGFRIFRISLKFRRFFFFFKWKLRLGLE